MPWVRLDEEFPEHPKVAQVGPLAGWLHVCALAYCNRRLTDGFVPVGMMNRLADFEGVSEGVIDGDARGCEVDASLLIDRLVAAGMWRPAPGGWLIHDFHDYQPAKVDVLAVREQKAEAGRRGGIASGQARRAKAEAAKQDRSTTEAQGQAKAKPVPVPVPLVGNHSSSPTGIAPADDEWIEQEARADLAARHLAAANGRAEPVRDEERWLAEARCRVRARGRPKPPLSLVPPAFVPAPYIGDVATNLAGIAEARSALGRSGAAS